MPRHQVRSIIEKAPRPKPQRPLLLNQQQAARVLGRCPEEFAKLDIPFVRLPGSPRKFWRLADLEKFVSELEPVYD